MNANDNTILSGFRQRLAAERRRMVFDEADKGSIPPAGFLSRLANLDSAIAAIEAVIEEDASQPPTSQNQRIA